MFVRGKVVLGQEQDIDRWMELVKKINHNFPGLRNEKEIKEHKQMVIKFMRRHEAYCIKNGDDIIGVILFSRKYNMICCIGVDEAYRRKGVAKALLLEAMATMDRTKSIKVATFREDDENGVAPRAFYKKLGFVEGKLVEEFGYPSQIMILHPKTCNSHQTHSVY